MEIRNAIAVGFALLSMLVLPATGVGQTASPGAWSGGTAETISQGRMERGIFLPLRYGATDRVELSAFPLAEFLVPNVRAKIGWLEGKDAAFSTVHALAYPTPLLNTFAREGTGGILPATSDIPPMLTIRNGLMWSRGIGERGHTLTHSFYVTTTPRFAQADFTTIDFPVVYPRTASYHTFATFQTGLDVRGPIGAGFGYRVGADLHVLPGLDGALVFEQTGRIGWSAGPRFRAMIGYLFSSGQYPFGRQANVYPVFDAQFAWDIPAPN